MLISGSTNPNAIELNCDANKETHQLIKSFQLPLREIREPKQLICLSMYEREVISEEIML